MKRIYFDENEKLTIKRVSLIAGGCIILLILLCLLRCSCKNGGRGKAVTDETAVEDSTGSLEADAEAEALLQAQLEAEEKARLEKEALEKAEREAEEKARIEAEKELSAKERKAAEKKRKEEEKRLEAERKRKADEAAKEAELKAKREAEEKRKAEAERKRAEEARRKAEADKKAASNKIANDLNNIYKKYESSESDTEKDALLKEAMELSEKALADNQNNDQAHYFMSQNALNNKDVDKAIDELNKAITIKENYLYYYELGKLLYMKRNYNGAINAFSKSCELNNQFAPSRYNLGLTYLKVSKPDKALACYNQAIEIRPNYEPAYLGKGRLYKQVGKYSDALDCYNKVLEINPRNVSARMDMGVIYNEQGRYAQAIYIYKEALGISSKGEMQTIIKYNLSVALYNNGDLAEGLQIASESYNEKDYVRNKEVKSNLIYNYGLLLDQNGKTLQAIDIYKEALALNNKHLKAKINLSAIYMGDGNDLEEALRLLREAYVISPKNFEVNNNLGNAYSLKGDYRNAVIYFENALQINPDDKVVRKNLANCLLKAEDYANAEKVYVDIVKDEPTNYQAYLDLAKVYIQLGQDDKAMYYLVYLQTNVPEFKTAEVDSLLAVLNI